MRSREQPLQAEEFDQQAVPEAPCQGQTVITFWGDHIHKRLMDKIENFGS